MGEYPTRCPRQLPNTCGIAIKEIDLNQSINQFIKTVKPRARLSHVVWRWVSVSCRLLTAGGLCDTMSCTDVYANHKYRANLVLQIFCELLLLM